MIFVFRSMFILHGQYRLLIIIILHYYTNRVSINIQILFSIKATINILDLRLIVLTPLMCMYRVALMVLPTSIFNRRKR